MTLDRRVGTVAVVSVVALVAAGAGIARAVSDGSEEHVSGPARERAAEAALAVVDGTVLEVERQDGDGAGVYEVEVRRADGSAVEIHLDARFQRVGSASDDDGAAGEDGDEAEPGSDD
jgi:hypothetical protein